MRFRKVLLAVALGGAVVVAVTGASAAGRGALDLTNIANANPKTVGMTQPNILSPELQEVVWAQGSYKLDGGTPQVPSYGYDGNGPFIPTAFTGTNGLTATEAQKTEPDKKDTLKTEASQPDGVILPPIQPREAGSGERLTLPSALPRRDQVLERRP